MNYLEIFATNNPTALSVCAIIIGTVIGSFLNVVIYRLPKMMEQAWENELNALQGKPINNRTFNLLKPRSSCDTCNHTIRLYENIPLASYLLLKGKCRYCGHTIRPRYPIIELLSGLITGYFAWKFGWSFHTIATSIFALSLLTLTCIDLETHLLPDNITLPLIWIGLLFNLNKEFTSLESAVIGAALGYSILWMVYWIFKLITNKEGMGYGDFKMLAAIGAWLGLEAVLPVIIISSLAASFVGVTLILLRQQNRASAIPFGPYLALGAMITLLNSSTIRQWIGG